MSLRVLVIESLMCSGKEGPLYQIRIAYVLCPVVQSVASLTSSLRVISLTVLADSIHNILIFFAIKSVSSFCTSYPHFFSAKISAYLRITRLKF